jgi:hypothetical protein
MSEHVDAKVAAYMAEVAAALASVPLCKTSYGEFFVSQAVISFSDTETGYAVEADDLGGYSLNFDRKRRDSNDEQESGR